MRGKEVAFNAKLTFHPKLIQLNGQFSCAVKLEFFVLIIQHRQQKYTTCSLNEIGCRIFHLNAKVKKPKFDELEMPFCLMNK